MKEWYQRIKKRRGAKIARVAVMRRLATILWHMLKHNQALPANWQARERKRPQLRLCAAGPNSVF